MSSFNRTFVLNTSHMFAGMPCRNEMAGFHPSPVNLEESISFFGVPSGLVRVENELASETDDCRRSSPPIPG